MNGSEILDILREMSVLIFLLSAPMLLSALVIGILISLVQAITQIQEMTLTFVPKLIIVVVMALWIMPKLLHSFSTFSITLYSKIAGH